jgi:hypothetical protein
MFPPVSTSLNSWGKVMGSNVKPFKVDMKSIKSSEYK